jgi:hypothetical protein
MGSSEPRLVKSQTEVSILSCKTGRSLGCSWHFGNLGVLEGHDLPLPLFLYDDQGRRVSISRISLPSLNCTCARANAMVTSGLTKRMLRNVKLA